MTPEEISGNKTRMYSFIGLGIAALIGAWQFSALNSVLPMQMIFIGVAVLCFVAAGFMARGIMKSASAK